MKFAISTLVLSVFIAQPAFSMCMVATAKIKGNIAGSATKKGICLVRVDVEKVTKIMDCASPVKVGDSIIIATDLESSNCPEDEGPVNGTVTNPKPGNPLRFNGTVNSTPTKSK